MSWSNDTYFTLIDSALIKPTKMRRLEVFHSSDTIRWSLLSLRQQKHWLERSISVWACWKLLAATLILSRNQLGRGHRWGCRANSRIGKVSWWLQRRHNRVKALRQVHQVPRSLCSKSWKKARKKGHWAVGLSCRRATTHNEIQKDRRHRPGDLHHCNTT